jgi:hypothetical protein
LEDLIETVTRGNPTEVKVILASVALALAVYQLVLISVAYGKVKLPFLGAPPASQAHRAVGDSIAVVLVVVAAEQEAAEERLGAARRTPRGASRAPRGTPRGALKKVARAAHPATFARGSCLTSTPGNDPCLTDS